VATRRLQHEFAQPPRLIEGRLQHGSALRQHVAVHVAVQTIDVVADMQLRLAAGLDGRGSEPRPVCFCSLSLPGRGLG